MISLLSMWIQNFYVDTIALTIYVAPTLPHNLIKEKLTELIEQTFKRDGSLYLACNENAHFFISEQPTRF